MKGLIIKDIIITLKQKSLLILMAVCAVICCITIKDPTFIIGYTCLVCASIGTTTCAYDELNNGMAFLMTLPYSRDKYVMEKYLYSLTFGLIAWITASAIAVLAMAATHQKLDAQFFLTDLFFVVPLLLIPALMIPIILKFGQARSRIVVFVIIGIVFALGGIVALAGSLNITVANEFKQLEIVSYGLKNAVPNFAAAGVATGISAVFYTVSFIISLLIMKNKEY